MYYLSQAGHTALHLACQLNRIEAAEELIKKGINISLKDGVS
jgi:ankyrin repeat protein